MARPLILLKYYDLPFGLSLRLLREVGPAHKREGVIVKAYDVLCVILTIAGRAVQWLAVAILLYAALRLTGVSIAHAAPSDIPRAALKYRAELTGVARQELGLDAPISLLAAQIHQESAWNENAVSPAGAQGLSQFMPATAKWLPEVAPHTGEPLPFNPAWAIRALCAYDKYLYDRVTGTPRLCDRWAYTLSAYNGGLGWVGRDRAMATRAGLDPARYWGEVETVNAGRSAANFRENRNYPRRIFAIQEIYEAAGWGKGVHCE